MHAPRCRTPRRLLAGLAILGLALWLPLAGTFGQQTPPKPNGEAAAVARGPTDATLPAGWVKALTWRSIGPANMGGRITALSVYEADPSRFHVATASGGLLRTTNNGTTFQHQFDREATVSIGDVCIAPSDPNIVWVGTGENNPRNSVSYGDGVYKSTDGGKTWKNMGLKQTFQIGRLAIHPKNPNVVYVGALGRLYGPNPERGLFKTTDGGRTWQKILYFDENTGVIDIAMHPADPDTLLVAMWERRRDGFDSYLGGTPPDGYDVYDPITRWGPHAGIYKTTDGGATFKKMTTGLPTSHLGRISLDYFRKDPNVVYAVVDCAKIGMGTPPKVVAAQPYLGGAGEDGEPGARLTVVADGGPAAKAGLTVGDVIVAINKVPIDSYYDLLDQIAEFKAGDKARVRFMRDQQAREVDVTFGKRPGPPGGVGGPGGPKKSRPYHAYYGGQKENVGNEQGPDAFEYGGIYKSTDGGASWMRVNSLNPRPMYFCVVRVDPSDSRYVYVLGVQQFRSSNGGKTFRPSLAPGTHADGHALWIDPKNGRHMILGTDGGQYVSYDRGKTWDHLNTNALGQFYHVAVCNKRPYWVYGGLQDNGTWGGPSMGLRGHGPINEDWVGVGGDDGFVCRVDANDPDLVYYESQNGVMFRRNLRTGERGTIRPAGDPKEPKGKTGKKDRRHRFNWNTPFILSSHNPSIFYAAGERVFKSLKRGDDLRPISPEIPLSKRGSATALAESPKNPDVLWVGTDDGGLWVTRDGGRQWSNLTARIGLPAPRWVATIEPSRFVEGRCYVAFDGHRSDDDKPYIYVTEDHGETWRPLHGGLPAFGSTRCLREDVKNKDLLYVGTEFGVFASLDQGNTWAKINNNLPTVAVHEIAIHPTAGEIVAATHGRSLWILDVSALRQLTPEALQATAFLYQPKDAVRWQLQPATGGTNRRFVGQNPPPGTQLYYSLTRPAQEVAVKVYDIGGKVVRSAKALTTPGLHRINWDLTRTFTKPATKGTKGTKGKTGKSGAGAFTGRAQAPPGDYRVVLTVDGQEFMRTFRVEADPNVPQRIGAAEDEESEDEEEGEGEPGERRREPVIR